MGIIGYGFSEDSFWLAVEGDVDAIIADCGSTDSGPQKLARGTTTVTREAYHRDLDVMLAACSLRHVPILLGSVGGDGADGHVELFLKLIRELIEERGYRSMIVFTIYSEIERISLKESFTNHYTHPKSDIRSVRFRL